MGPLNRFYMGKGEPKQLPKFHETFIPILKVLGSGEVVRVSDLRKSLQNQFYADLSNELLEKKTKSGNSLLFDRIAWGKTHLKQAGMIQQPSRGMVQITDKGREVLRRGTLTLRDVLQDRDFLARRLEAGEPQEPEAVEEGESPQDLIDRGIQAVEVQAKEELLSKLKTTDPYYFEKVVLLLLEKMGYGASKETAKSRDGGIDGEINQDALGLEKIFIQTKRYTENKVRETDIRGFIGAMSRSANKGIFVTTSSFDDAAILKAHDAQQKIILIDGPMLVDLMHKYDVGVQVRETYFVKEVDEDFFEEA